MTLINPITYLTQQGLTITIVNNKLNVKPSSLVTKEIADYIKQHKGNIKNELLAVASQNVGKLPRLDQLTLQQRRWLEEIAELLQTTPCVLIAQQLIDQYDLVELVDKEPVLIANSIKTGYYWIKNII